MSDKKKNPLIQALQSLELLMIAQEIEEEGGVEKWVRKKLFQVCIFILVVVVIIIFGIIITFIKGWG